MHCHWLQHVPFEGLGGIGCWMEAQAATLTVTRLYADEPLPTPKELAGIDWLVVMGGPMGVHDEARYGWLAEEKRLIAAALAAGGPRVLGICLGAQLIADALGARVVALPHQEVGWHDVTLSAEARRSPLFRDLPAQFPMFHWHGERFDMPAEAISLGSSAGCAQQGFALGRRVLALQCHPEMMALAARELVAAALPACTPGPYVQSAEQILGDAARFNELSPTLVALLDAMQAG